jgi:hypothetical protein
MEKYGIMLMIINYFFVKSAGGIKQAVEGLGRKVWVTGLTRILDRTPIPPHLAEPEPTSFSPKHNDAEFWSTDRALFSTL